MKLTGLRSRNVVNRLGGEPNPSLLDQGINWLGNQLMPYFVTPGPLTPQPLKYSTGYIPQGVKEVPRTVMGNGKWGLAPWIKDFAADIERYGEWPAPPRRGIQGTFQLAKDTYADINQKFDPPAASPWRTAAPRGPVSRSRNTDRAVAENTAAVRAAMRAAASRSTPQSIAG